MLPVPQTLELMEAKAVPDLPKGEAWRYEPKWDGYRCLAFRDGKNVSIYSKRGTLLNRYFPEVVAGLGKLKARKFVLDGELLVMTAGKGGAGRPEFDSLQLRMHPAESRIAKLSKQIPAHLRAFDLLADAKGKDLRGIAFADRRDALEAFIGKLGKQDMVLLSPQTASLKMARGWLKMADAGLDGIVAKLADLPYQPGKRAMQKFKLWKSIDAVIGGLYLDDCGHVEHLLLGLYDEAGKLNYIGRCRTPGTEAEIRKKLKPVMATGKSDEGFNGHAPAAENRWSGKKHVYVPLKPRLVLEASADHVAGGRMRHGSRFIRWRPDKKPSQCKMEQVEQ
jgi:ATP-dependent DNA ligase